MKIHSTNYYDVFVEEAEDTKADAGKKRLIILNLDNIEIQQYPLRTKFIMMKLKFFDWNRGISSMKAIFKTIIVLFLTSFSSCNGLGPVDTHLETNNFNVSESEFFGTWKIDTFSYKYLSGKLSDSISVLFHADSTFEMNNSVSLFDNEIDNINTTGNWTIIKRNNSVNLKITFNNSNNERELEIYKDGDSYQLWYFLSDPDTGERIRFIK